MLHLKVGVPPWIMCLQVGNTLKSFVKTSHKHIKIMSDNTTTFHCINEMSTSHSMECHHQVLKIWEWAIIHKNHLSAAHIPGKLNTVTDKESRYIMLILNGCSNQRF